MLSYDVPIDTGAQLKNCCLPPWQRPDRCCATLRIASSLGMKDVCKLLIYRSSFWGGKVLLTHIVMKHHWNEVGKICWGQNLQKFKSVTFEIFTLEIPDVFESQKQGLESRFRDSKTEKWEFLFLTPPPRFFFHVLQLSGWGGGQGTSPKIEEIVGTALTHFQPVKEKSVGPKFKIFELLFVWLFYYEKKKHFLQRNFWIWSRSEK